MSYSAMTEDKKIVPDIATAIKELALAIACRDDIFN